MKASPRWLVPLGVGGVVLLGATVGSAVTAGATPELAPRTAQELLVQVANAHPAGFSGTVEQRADLGLPSLPTPPGISTSVLGLLAGTHSLRVAYADRDHVRVGLLAPLAETEIIHSGSDLWTYDSAKNAVTHTTVAPQPAEPPTGPTAATAPGLPPTPESLAAQVLAAIDPTTEVSVGRNDEVANRPAYDLVLTPKSPASLIAVVSLAIDAESGMPLRVSVTARGHSTPSLVSGYSSLDPKVPDASTFAFAPPPGASVKEGGSGPHLGSGGTEQGQQDPQARPSDQPKLIGTGWEAVVLITGVSQSSGQLPAQTRSLLALGQQVSGAFGTGRLFRTTLLTALLTDDGRLYAGAVTPEAIQAAAAPRP
ncbi:MAG: hypothetical protein M3Z02_03435 [Actinomycetota bacterium]|nr:hypothetical protein [Actinomycetota bacterium]